VRSWEEGKSRPPVDIPSLLLTKRSVPCILEWDEDNLPILGVGGRKEPVQKRDWKPEQEVGLRPGAGVWNPGWVLAEEWNSNSLRTGNTEPRMKGDMTVAGMCQAPRQSE